MNNIQRFIKDILIPLCGIILIGSVILNVLFIRSYNETQENPNKETLEWVNSHIDEVKRVKTSHENYLKAADEAFKASLGEIESKE